MPMTRAMTARHNREGGFTLLEILVAIVVISLGLLGLAGLQVVSLNGNQIAYYRGLAAQQTYDMTDRIRANVAGVGAGNYDAPTATTDPGCIDSACSESQIASADFVQWNNTNALLLPGGAGTVQCAIGPTVPCTNVVASSNRVFDITVTWIEKNMGDTGASSSDTNCPAGTAPNTRCFVTRFVP